jgi:hypothetical protein
MKIIPFLTVAVLMLSNLCSLAEESRKSGDDEELILEVVWKDPESPECRLRDKVSADGSFMLQSKDGKHAAVGKVGTPNDEGYPVTLALFNWRSERSHGIAYNEPRLRLGISHKSITVHGLWRECSVTLSRAASLDSEKPKKVTEQGGAGQPATRPEPKSKGGDKPQPETERRSR